jgi:serine/threonine-protein kinase HipA
MGYAAVDSQQSTGPFGAKGLGESGCFGVASAMAQAIDDAVGVRIVSLPITPDRTVAGPVVANFFDNLLPDDERIRRRASARFRVGSTEVFDLLQAIGRDCVGAVQLLPPEQPPIGFDRVEYEPMDDEAVARHLRGVAAEPGLGADQDPDDLRISIAGAQEKTALLRVDGQWCRPLGATPTTHILKLPLGLVGGSRLDLTHSVYNEWLCAQLLRELDLPVATTDIATFGNETVLAVERTHRKLERQPRATAREPPDPPGRVATQQTDRAAPPPGRCRGSSRRLSSRARGRRSP